MTALSAAKASSTMPGRPTFVLSTSSLRGPNAFVEVHGAATISHESASFDTWTGSTQWPYNDVFMTFADGAWMAGKWFVDCEISVASGATNSVAVHVQGLTSTKQTATVQSATYMTPADGHLAFGFIFPPTTRAGTLALVVPAGQAWEWKSCTLEPVP